MNNIDRLRRNYIHFVTIRQQRGLDKKLQKLPARFYEKHHILPRSCGGGNEPSNLVLLTFREHWVAHYLLDQFSEGADKRKMQFALSRVSSKAKPGELQPLAYAIGKAAKSEALSALAAIGLNPGQSTKSRATASKRMTKRNNELAAIGLHPAQKEGNRAATSKRMTKHMTDLAAAGLNPFQSEECKAATSKRTTKRNKELAAAGLNPLLTHENRAASSKRNKELAAIGLHPSQSEANRAAQSKRCAEQVTCPHCSKTGQNVVMARWHFDNCKHNPASKRYIAK